MFAGPQRDTGIPEVLQRLAATTPKRCSMVVDSFDILRSTSHDLLDKTLQEDLIQKLKNGCYQAVIMSPPCATWSRAPWANEFGPKPLRSSVHPLWFPWLEGHKLDKVSKSNAMVEFCLQVISLAIQLGLAFLLEHPEDLGATTRWGGDTRPASIWQLLPIVSWVHAGDALTGAFYQCQLGATSPKPTRLLHNLPGLQRYLAAGLPLLDGANLYQGPLPKNCNCGRRHTCLIRQATDNTFATAAAAAYPPAMDHWLASTLFDHLLKGDLTKRPKRTKRTRGRTHLIWIIKILKVTLLIVDQILKISKGNHLVTLEEANVMVLSVKEKARRTLKVTILALSTGKVELRRRLSLHQRGLGSNQTCQGLVDEVPGPHTKSGIKGKRGGWWMGLG